MTILRTAVLGLGRIGWTFHVPQIAKHEGFKLVAAVDPLPERRTEAEAQYGLTAYADPEAMFAAQPLDLVVVASPTPFHADQVIAAFAHGCHVFCDKPLAPNLAEADRIIAAMTRYGRKLMVYQPHRCTPLAVSLRDLLGRDLIGPVYLVKAASSWYDRRNDWQAFAKNGGGMLNNYGAHFLDQLLYLTGGRARRITCHLRCIATLGDADDVVKALIETDSGVILDLDINMAAAHAFPKYQFLGKYGSILLDPEGKNWLVRYFRPAELAAVATQEGLAAAGRRYGNGETIPWHEERFALESFAQVDFYGKCYDFFGRDLPPFVPIAETREVMRILDECRRSSAASA